MERRAGQTVGLRVAGQGGRVAVVRATVGNPGDRGDGREVLMVGRRGGHSQAHPGSRVAGDRVACRDHVQTGPYADENIFDTRTSSVGC